MQKASLYSSSKSLKVLAPKLRFKNDYGKDYPEWKEKNLGDIASLSTGRSYANELCNNGKYVVMDMGAISKEGTIIGSKRTNLNRNLLNKDDLVMPKDDIGGGLIICKTAYIPDNNKYVLGDHVYRLRFPKENSLFMHYLINSEHVNLSLKRKVTGSAQLGIRAESLLKEKIFIACLEEQERIVNLFKYIDDRIATQDRLVTLLNMYKRGVLNQIFGQMTVDQISIKLKEVINPLKKTVHQAEEGKEKGIYPFFTNSTKNNQKYIDAYDYDDCVIIANTGGNAKFRYFDGKFAATSDCYIFKTSQNTQYIYYLLEYMTGRISKRGFRGNGIKHLDKTWFLNMDINIHLSEKQKQIASFLSMLDVRIQKEEHILEQLKTTKTGLLQQMFV